MTDTLQLGKIIDASRTVHRDAVHVAVVPVVAGKNYLASGDHTVQFGSQSWRDEFGYRAEGFWECYEELTANFFSCAC